jgi:hypothetical protein
LPPDVRKAYGFPAVPLPSLAAARLSLAAALFKNHQFNGKAEPFRTSSGKQQDQKRKAFRQHHDAD